MDQKKALSRTNTVIGSLKWWSSSSASSNSRLGGSTTISVQKLRESKWFGPDESRILCAVVERGFIVEIREGQENDSVFGVVHIKSSKDKKPRPESVEIFTLNTVAAATGNGHRRNHCQVVKQTLTELWQLGCIVRINNFGDKENAAHSAKDIKNQLAFAQKAKQMMWHNSQHFAYWCRYGERQEDARRRQVSLVLPSTIWV